MDAIWSNSIIFIDGALEILFLVLVDRAGPEEKVVVRGEEAEYQIAHI